MSTKFDPHLTLTDSQDQGAAPCGCRLVRDYAGCGNPAVILCKEHDAAPDLLAACEALLIAGDAPSFADAERTARKAVAKATP